MNIALQFLTRAKQIPEWPAITTGAETMNFAALADKTSRMAGSLLNTHSLRQGDRVLIWMENCAEVVESFLACWIAGLCVVPVNPKLHGQEVAHIHGNSGARVAFVSRSFAEAAAEHLGAVNCVPIIISDSAQYKDLFSGSAIDCAMVQPTDTAWIFYTSGTTGFPKGAMLSHRNLLFMTMSYYADIEQVHPGDTMLHCAPLSHGSGQYLIPHLLGGGHQVILDRFNPSSVLDALDSYARASMFAVPTMIMRLVTHAKLHGLAAPSKLRTLIYGGAPMYVSDLGSALDFFGPRLYQLYGQGETPMTISGLNQREHVGEDSEARRLTCGVARTGVEIRIMNENAVHLGPGEIGEIVVRSDCVMSGYWNDPQATARALRGGWLWTGDIGLIDAAGYLTLRDRSKDMLISGGSNIYPREIEEVLLTHPDVVECSVVGRAHKDLGEEPVAFIVLARGTQTSQSELDALCLASIARFKRPRAYRFVSALPKSSYGKILKSEIRRWLINEADAQPEQ